MAFLIGRREAATARAASKGRRRTRDLRNVAAMGINTILIEARS
jgi:hypothetical protein